MIEAPCAPAYVPYDINNREEHWRTKALAQAMPALLARVTDATLRATSWSRPKPSSSPNSRPRAP
ncbi:hypothetical protein [Streptomyces sp. AcE210]|uniref:hypothetical protein n=1 Tax=Streptomyces sp. AcE210 TaxID=2292703 RepID=UPI0010588502|nr:hypothetical protein [Streptomyces sp. AcE210]